MNWKEELDKKDEEEALKPPEMKAEDKFNVLGSPYWILVFVLLATPLFVMLTLIGNQIQIKGISVCATHIEAFTFLPALWRICSCAAGFLFHWLLSDARASRLSCSG